MHRPKIVSRRHDHGRGAELGGVAQDVYREARRRHSRGHGEQQDTTTSSSATRTPGVGLNRATITGHVAAPMPQQKLSAAERRCGTIGREPRDDQVGRRHDEPEADSCDRDRQRADDALAERQAGQAGRHQRVACRQRCAAAEPRHDQADSAPATMLPVNWMVKSAPAAASESNQRAVSHGSTGPSTVVTNPVTTKPVKSSGRPLRANRPVRSWPGDAD